MSVDATERASVIEHIDELNRRAREQQDLLSEESHQLAEDALAAAERVQYTPGIAAALCTLAWRQGQQGKYAEMLALAAKGLSLAKETGDDRLVARASSFIGTAYLNRGDFAAALDHYLSALETHSSRGDRVSLASTLGNIGIVYSRTGQYDKAADYFHRALRIYEEIGDRDGIGNMLGNIGTLYSHTADYAKALEHYLRAMEIAKETGNRNEVALMMSNAAVAHGNLGRHDEALEHILRALDIYTDTGNRSGIAVSLFNIGNLYALKEYPGHSTQKAIEYLTKALSLTNETGMKNLKIAVHQVLADVYREEEDWKSAYHHIDLFHTLEKEVFSDQSIRRISELEHRQRLIEIEREHELERKKSEITERLLNRILPAEVAQRIMAGGTRIADNIPSASVLFADIVGFTPLTQKLGSEQVVELLSQIFSHFDSLAEACGVEKIKTVGDSYMAAAGVPIECGDHAERIANLALAMQEEIKLKVNFSFDELSIRIGIHTGEVIAGVLGTQKLSYDIWGDTVNTAARMESHGEPDRIHCTEEMFIALQEKFSFEERGEIEIKGKGKMKTYFLVGEKL